jgi:hypothetical protein
VGYVNEQKIKALTVRQTPVVDNSKQIENARLQAENAKLKSEQEQQQATMEYSQFARSISMRGKEVARSLSGLDLQDESIEIETYFAKAASARNRATELSKEFAGRPPAQGVSAGGDAVNRGLQQTIGAAKFLDLYFKSEDDSQEEKREQAFRGAVRQAISSFDQADALMSNHR